MNNAATTPDIRHVFTQALRDPNAISEADFQMLLSEYPFAQSLVFAYQRRNTTSVRSTSTDNTTVQKALLHTDNRYWLRDLVGEHVEEIPSEYVEQDEITAPLETPEEEVLSKQPEDELADLILEQVQAVDYFALEKATDREVHTSEITAVVPVAVSEAGESEEDLSVYDDELMPYSFRWWLYKTRLKHANTYQPFVSIQSLSTRADGQFVPPKFDETILDHQIRENIFHLQDPEDKLSDSIRQKTVEVAMPKKTDAVIERFIREEPQITPPTPDIVNNENKARKSAEDHFSLVTETLANIYIEQGLYPKAIDVFRKLISINPEKKVYFASRIEELEQKF
ncbi:tetratricopeptide repeat protein [Sphingobacterium sp. lm-10]|uniref:tetratricopeptide repeat protein n=1 Tax=Sphingobacterium sp. lm-10 TaxID=2944904 RepID=UPI00202060C1|nr:tetratricopeptide repeat protein [Sphingobacterium sp. lm-10]MCL7989456.1 tetratricopeptide repeat protein [Sphingobacterium sp. lm-10]